MTLSTRCPTCATAFRVQPGQLSARGGKVRCGKCAAVFDGVANLVEEKPAVEAQAEAEPSPQLVLFEARKAPVAPPAANEEVVPEFLYQDEPPPPRRLLWGFGALAAVMALVLQLMVYYRTEIAVLVPESRELLVRGCALLTCELRLPRRPELMAIESSDLQADGRRENVILLNAVIRNRAPFAQEFPALELTLTDERDQPVVRRVLTPRDYLAPAALERLAQGLGSNAEAVLRISFDNSLLRAVGYRLYLFFP